MTATTIQSGFVSGELSPAMLGRVDQAKYRTGAATMRNMFVNYRGGASSRAGLAYVGMCAQAGSLPPPRDIKFQFSLTQGYALEFGEQYMRVKSNGGYVLEAAQSVAGITQANPAVFNVTGHGYSVGNWVYFASIGGMTEFNGLAWIVASVPDANHFTVTSLFGDAVNSTAYPPFTTGGTVARLYTLATPYHSADLPYLKTSQSADTMTLTCVNTATGTEYPPYELVRTTASSWTLTADDLGSAISAPINVNIVASASTTLTTFYSYQVTAVDITTGEESVASAPATAENNDIAVYAGSNTLSWSGTAMAGSYNVYLATPSYSAPVPGGGTYGYIGSSFGTSFVDTNIVADFTKVPPTHQNPFARGAILSVSMTANGTGYSQSTAGYAVTTSTGSGFVGEVIVTTGGVAALVVVNGGSGYAPADTVAFTNGTGAAATLNVGPQSGTYPGVSAYFQQRRFYAASLNNPDTYWASQPGAFLNFDYSTPTTDADAITGTPWAQQVNGIQFMVSMPGGLVVLTGQGAWQLSGGTSSAITPANQVASPQAYNGCNNIVAPVVIDYDIIYLQSKGSIFRDLSYNFFVNIYTGQDITEVSEHLFTGYTFTQMAYAEEPYKLVWAVRNDGALLSLAYVKPQEVMAWSRHDTNGQFLGVCTVTEPPVDAVYVITSRYVRGAYRYYAERMNNRAWPAQEDCWCLDCALQYPMPTPAATATTDSAGRVNTNVYASANVFALANVGNVIRLGGGKGTVTSFVTATQVVVDFSEQPITNLVPNDPNGAVVPALPGQWTMTAPTTVVTGLNHLEGEKVTILADGVLQPVQIVTGGAVTLAAAATAIIVGLSFTAQLQPMYLEPPGVPMTGQSKRKVIYSAAVRVDASAGFLIGTNQPDASAQPFNANVPWSSLIPVAVPSSTTLYTGDCFVPLNSEYDTRGQVAMQQAGLPLNVLALVSYYDVFDANT